MSIIDEVKEGELARLIPVAKKEESKATSALLAAFRVIPEFAHEILSQVGVNIGTRAKINCYTEVVFKRDTSKQMRPDGLIVVHSGKKEWSALVESKVGTASLTSEQLEKYLALAKDLGADALITISNDFALLPTHHPVPVSKQLLKKINLYHFSWLSIVSKALLLSDNKKLDDPERAFLLLELIRYFNHSSSGVSELTRMGKGWREICDQIQKGAPLQRLTNDLEDAVSSWSQLLRYLSLKMSVATSNAVQVPVPRRYRSDPEGQVKSFIDDIMKSGQISSDFEVPNVASPITFTADFMRRTIAFDMRLDAPQDIRRPTAAINWLTRQLRDVKEKDGVTIKVHWPKRIPMTVASLSAALESADVLVPSDTKEIPKSLEIAIVVDLAGKFRGSQTSIELSEEALKHFYSTVAQRLSAYQPKAPQLKTTEKSKTDDSPMSGLSDGIGSSSDNWSSNVKPAVVSPAVPEEATSSVQHGEGSQEEARRRKYFSLSLQSESDQ